jgi:hypothetical protein
MPPTTSQSVVVEDGVLDDVETVVGVVVAVSTGASTGFNGVVSPGVVWPGVVWLGVTAPAGRVGTVRTGLATVPKVVVGSVLVAAEHADNTTASDNALAKKTFDFGTGTPREIGNVPPTPRAHRSRAPLRACVTRARHFATDPFMIVSSDV